MAANPTEKQLPLRSGRWTVTLRYSHVPDNCRAIPGLLPDGGRVGAEAVFDSPRETRIRKASFEAIHETLTYNPADPLRLDTHALKHSTH